MIQKKTQFFCPTQNKKKILWPSANPAPNKSHPQNLIPITLAPPSRGFQNWGELNFSTDLWTSTQIEMPCCKNFPPGEGGAVGKTKPSSSRMMTLLSSFFSDTESRNKSCWENWTGCRETYYAFQQHRIRAIKASTWTQHLLGALFARIWKA